MKITTLQFTTDELVLNLFHNITLHFHKFITLFGYSLSFERFVCLDIRREPLNGSSSSDERYNEASPAQDLQPYPSERVLGDLSLRDVHLNREVDGEWIERGCPNQPQEVVEEWEYHGDHGCDYDITRSPHQPEEVDGVSAEARNIHIIFCGYEFVVWPSLSAARLDEAEYGLAKNLETERL